MAPRCRDRFSLDYGGGMPPQFHKELEVRKGPSVSFLSVTKVSPSESVSTIVMPLREKFKEKSEHSGSSSFLRGVSTRALVVISMMMIIILVSFGGGYLFLWIETSAPKKDVPIQEYCFEQVHKKIELEHISAENALAEMKQCMEKETTIRTASEGVLYAWELYTTVGYGDRFPHTLWGQIVSIAYAWACIPLYMAFKIEFGECVALGILHLGKFIFKGIRHFLPKITRRQLKSDHPSDGLLATVLSLIFLIFAAITATILMFLQDLTWFDSFYMTMISMPLIGLGDYSPDCSWLTFAFVLPLFLLGDTLNSYLNYYMHGLFRVNVHKVARYATGQSESQTDTTCSNANLNRRASAFPIITTTSMPLNIMAEDYNMADLYSETACTPEIHIEDCNCETEEKDKDRY